MKFINIYKQATLQFLHHEGPVSSGHLAFLTMLGLFPFLIFIISIAAFAGQSNAGIEIINYIFSELPTDVQNVLQMPVYRLLNDTSGSILITSILGAIWVSSSTVNAARAAIRRAYNMQERPAFWRERLESVILVLLSGLAMVAGMIILVLGPTVVEAANTVIPISRAWLVFSNYASLLTSMILMLPAVYGIYFTFGPHGRRRQTPLLPGALTTIILWSSVGGAFSTYLKYFGQYSNTYGSLAGPIIALMFFYAVNAAFLFGAEVNSAVLKAYTDKQNEKLSDIKE